MTKQFVALLVGLFLGYNGIAVAIHVAYNVIIIALLILHFMK